jgi:dolichyl-phosphate-mannose-protein mannosyltransferase
MLARLNRPLVAIVLVTALAGFVRFFALSHPDEMVFDEVYYPKAGCILIGESNEVCRIDSSDERFWRRDKWDVGSWVHPPLGKWQIGMGIKAFGMDPFGWRVTSALAGTLAVTGVALIAQLLFRRPVWTFVAGGLLALEGLNVVLSRTALLDVHLEFWIVVGYLLVLLDRRWIERRTPVMPTEMPTDAPTVLADAALDHPGPRHPPVFSPIWRPWRFAAGVAFGAAASVKWSGAFALLGTFVLSYLWETTRRRHNGERRPLRGALVRESFGIVLAFVFVPLLVYVAVWLPWIHHFEWDWAKWWDTQMGAIRYHGSGLEWTEVDPDTGSATPTHPYYSRPWEWIAMLRPTSFYVKDVGPEIQDILAIGNPAVFWGSLVALPYLPFAWRRLRDWRAGFILVGFASQYVPWFFASRPTFFFYALPLTPFLVLSVTYLLRQLSDAKLIVRDRDTGEVAVNPETGRPAISAAYVYRPFVWVYLAAATLLFAWFWPVLTARQIPDWWWRAIVWFNRWI